MYLYIYPSIYLSRANPRKGSDGIVQVREAVARPASPEIEIEI